MAKITPSFSSLTHDDRNIIQEALDQETKRIQDRAIADADRKINAITQGGRVEQIEEQLPWEGAFASKIGPEESAFFGPYDIDGDRWKGLYPYRFVVIDVNKNNSIVSDSAIAGPKSPSVSVFSKSVGTKGIEYIYIQEISKSWEAPLPISPQQLVVEDIFAINNQATMRGIIEEHNGIKYKMISASGTFGIWPSKPARGGDITPPSSILGQVFGDTIGAIGNLAASARNIKTMFDGGHPNKQAPPEPPENRSTGYYHALFLGQFLERYAQAKKRPENKGWRLVFDIPKQNQSFIVTPMNYKMKQSKEHPNEIRFDFRLKAWKRVKIGGSGVEPAGFESFNISPTKLQNFINGIGQIRRTLGDASNLIKAVRSDSQRIFNILRQSTLALKDLSNVVAAVGDLPQQILGDLSSTIKDSIANISDAFQKPNDRFRADNEVGTLLKGLGGNDTPLSAQKAGAAAASISSKKSASEGLSEDQISSGSLGQDAVDQLATDPINNVFNNPEENFDLFDAVNIDDLQITPEQEEAIERELERVRLLNVDDFRDFKEEMLSLSSDIADNFGSGDQTYSNIYGITDPTSRAIPMSVEENEVLIALFEVIQIYDALTSTKQYDDFDIESPLEYVGGLAADTDIDFDQFPSKVPVPVPLNSTIEEIAARYMGDADKWLEIVTLNGMRSPYIDEVGFILPFQSNGDGRRFSIFDEDSRFYIGQTVVLRSNTIPQSPRKIIDLEEISDNNFLISVDGEGDLDNLTTSQNASVQGYLPGTINSQNQIYIPVSEEAAQDDRIFDIPNISDNSLSKLSKVDFLLEDSGDIAINSVGDFRLSTGLTNLIQALKLKIKTRKGTLLRHLDYGLGIGVGFSVADFQSGFVIQEMNKMIEEDERFAAIDTIKINLTGSTLAIDMTIKIANNNGVLPISLNVPIR